jgi:hypothetical protein
MQFISDLSKEHFDFLKPTEGLFPSKGTSTWHIYDRVQDVHPKTLLCMLLMSIIGDKTLERFEHLVDFVDRSCVEDAAVHLDVARGAQEKSKLKQCELAESLMPLQWYLKHLDLDRTNFWEMKEEVTRRAHHFYDLIIARTTEGRYTLEDALDLCEPFYYIHRQPTWEDFSGELLVLGVLQVDGL